MNLTELNKKYQQIDALDRVKALFDEFNADDILVTSSFGTTASILLDMVSKAKPGHPIYTINTGYLFDETHEYQKQLTKQLNLNVLTVGAEEKNHEFTSRNQTYQGNTDLCCYINKVQPLDLIKKDYKIWISGLLGYQNANRDGKQIFEQKKEIVKFYPIIDFPQDMAEAYKVINELPEHPLLSQGYASVGCTHCTAKGEGREGRWAGASKTECGLHT